MLDGFSPTTDSCRSEPTVPEEILLKLPVGPATVVDPLKATAFMPDPDLMVRNKLAQRLYSELATRASRLVKQVPVTLVDNYRRSVSEQASMPV